MPHAQKWVMALCAAMITAALTAIGAPAAGASPAPTPPPPGGVLAPTKSVKSYQYAGTTDPNQSLTATRYTARTGAPWVLTIHGGSWINGTQANMQGFVNLFYGHGWQAFNMSYRVGPTVTFVQQRADIIAARNFIQSRAALFGINPHRGTVVGFSAGGHLAAIGGNLGGFGAVLSVSGVLQPQRLVRTFAGDTATSWESYIAARAETMAGCAYADNIDSNPACESAWTAFEPEKGITAHTPPTYVMYGTDDPAIPTASSTAYYYWLMRHQVPRAVVGVPGYGHDPHLLFDSPARESAMLRFILKATP